MWVTAAFLHLIIAVRKISFHNEILLREVDPCIVSVFWQFGYLNSNWLIKTNQPIQADRCIPPSHDGAFQFKLHRQELDRWGSSGEDRNNQTWRREELLGWRKFSLTLPRTFITSRRHLTTEIVLYFIFVFFTLASVEHRVFQAPFWTVNWLIGECFNPDRIFIESLSPGMILCQTLSACQTSKNTTIHVESIDVDSYIHPSEKQ